MKVRFKKAVILMGTNAAGKTSFERALLKIFDAIKDANEAILRELNEGDFISDRMQKTSVDI